MVDAHDDKPLRRAARTVTTTNWGAKAQQIAASLKAQHAAGRDGDESPAVPIWPTPKEQLDAVKHLFRTKPNAAKPELAADPAMEPPTTPETATDTESQLDADAEEVAEALRRVDWSEVRAATAGRANDVTRTMRSLADQVDWTKVQPVAAQVSSALIAAVTAGRIPVGGRFGPIVVKAITDQNNLGKRIAVNLEDSHAQMPPDFRTVIETTARE